LAQEQLNRGTRNCPSNLRREKNKNKIKKGATNNRNGQSKGIQRHAKEISIETFALNNNQRKKVLNKTGVSNSPATTRKCFSQCDDDDLEYI
jgi:hypothetical protein